MVLSKAGWHRLIVEGPTRTKRPKKESPLFELKHPSFSALRHPTPGSWAPDAPVSQGFGLTLNYITAFPGPSACRGKITRFPSLYNHVCKLQYLLLYVSI